LSRANFELADMRKSITLIAAMGKNREIGLAGRMPWHLPAELQHFKRTTMGKAILMGRKTWQAIGRPLPGRQNIVITRNPVYEAAGADVCNSLAAAIEVSRSEEIMVIGGGQLYALAMPLARRMVLTLIDIQPDADTWFPEWEHDAWQRVAEQHFQADGDDGLAYQIVELKRLK